jgi:hypothetical protein
MAIFALGALLGTELPGSVSPLIRKMSLLTREGAPFFWFRLEFGIGRGRRLGCETD